MKAHVDSVSNFLGGIIDEHKEMAQDAYSNV